MPEEMYDRKVMETVTLTIDGRPVTVEKGKTVLQAAIESGVKKDRTRRLTPFSLRHTAGIMMVDNGATIDELMERMRIEWKPTAQIYFRLRGSLGSVAPPSVSALRLSTSSAAAKASRTRRSLKGGRSVLNW